MGCPGTRILAQKILCILKLWTDIFLIVPVLCQDIAYIIHEKGSLNKEKPCNVVLNIYLFIYIYIYI